MGTPNVPSRAVAEAAARRWDHATEAITGRDMAPEVPPEQAGWQEAHPEILTARYAPATRFAATTLSGFAQRASTISKSA